MKAALPAACLSIVLCTVPAFAQVIAPEPAVTGAAVVVTDGPVVPRAPFTLDVLYSHGFLDGGQPQANAGYARGTWESEGGDVARLELLDETKFGSHGGIVGGAYSHVLASDWILAGAVAFGHGGVNWANERADLEVTKKWLESQSFLTRIAVYGARYDGNRSDVGIRASVVGYLPWHVVLEGGVISNVSDPGRVASLQRFASITWGSDGDQYLSARASYGTEGYQAVAAGQQLVGFHSNSISANWRRWMAPRWGFIVQGERYRNPGYARETAGVGLFSQW